jgi:2',3'-cyclic-nucleotide 2'-phosphodiesterase
MIGDIVGDTGRKLIEKYLPDLKAKHTIHVVVLNGENSAHGKGITPKIADFLKSIGVDVITTGNHVWAKREIYSYIQANKFLLRPANFQQGSPGVGLYIHETMLGPVAVINIQGRVFMKEFVECPFRTIDSLLLYLKNKTKLIFVDFHAEATAEKLGMAFYLDGKISGFVGTHTHVQTADARILPKGTAYITDLGMCGSLNSMIGQKKDAIIQHMITQMPIQFEVDTEPPFVLSGVIIETDTETGLSKKIERVYMVEG